MRQQKKGDRSAQASAGPRNITRMKRSCDNRNIHSTLETPGLPPDIARMKRSCDNRKSYSRLETTGLPPAEGHCENEKVMRQQKIPLHANTSSQISRLLDVNYMGCWANMAIDFRDHHICSCSEETEGYCGAMKRS
ncbi:hypothetical protein M378DRAFT_163089 [Amanita muscaria Koide BX008]|uniref:Uncharacterized protein n=1 Tax=Amanita muscaria (strain Koide BX008) TaxID=946122 RepID=A0A0C2TCV0_AMAMK|nr:hypothetical protein M378DRAFT_163089 [Amanita muscaria Koide BX008]